MRDAERAPEPEPEARRPAAASPIAAPTAATRTLALQRAAGNRATARMLQRDTVDMPPLTITSTRPTVEGGVQGLQHLRGAGVRPDDPTITRDQAVIEANSTPTGTALPFQGTGWDASAILRRLGQYDRNTGTDSDALRCVQ